MTLYKTLKEESSEKKITISIITTIIDDTQLLHFHISIFEHTCIVAICCWL